MNIRIEKIFYCVSWSVFTTISFIFGGAIALGYIHLMSFLHIDVFQIQDSEISHILITTIGYTITNMILGSTMVISGLIITNVIFGKKIGEVWGTSENDLNKGENKLV